MSRPRKLTDEQRALNLKASQRRQKLNDRLSGKAAARIATAKAIRNGEITKPEKCENCGLSRKLEAHHEKYTPPYMVRFLCRQCHCWTHRMIDAQRRYDAN